MESILSWKFKKTTTSVVWEKAKQQTYNDFWKISHSEKLVSRSIYAVYVFAELIWHSTYSI